MALGVFGDLPPDNLLHAVRETMAHLIYLRRQGLVVEERRSEGGGLWSRV